MFAEIKSLPRAVSEKLGLYNPSIEETILEINNWAKTTERHAQIKNRFSLTETESSLYELLIREQLAITKTIDVPKKYTYYNTLEIIYDMFNRQVDNVIAGNKAASPHIIDYLRNCATQISEDFLFSERFERVVNLEQTGLMLAFGFYDLKRKL